ALRDLQQLGEDLGMHLPELLKWRDHMRSGHPTPPGPPPPHAPEPPRPPSYSPWTSEEGSEPQRSAESTSNGFQPTVELAARMRQIAEELGSEDLDSERRQDLIRELSNLTSGRA